MYSSSCFLQLIVLSRSPSPPPLRKHHTYCRPEREINKHTAQRRAISSARAPLGSITAPFTPNNHGPLLPPPFTCFSCILPCATLASGVRRPRSGALCFLWNTQSSTRQQVLGEVPGTRYRRYARLLSFCFCLFAFVLHLRPLRDFFFANYTRTTADQNVTWPTYSTAQTGRSAPHK